MIRAAVGWTVATATSLLLLAACTSAHTNHSRAITSPSTSASPASPVDAAFVTTMTQLAAQNLNMADLVATRAGHAQLTSFVPAVQQRAGDIQAMRDWLGQWHGIPTSTGSPTGITTTMLSAMAAMHGATFDDDWLEHMGDNYANAIAACRYELAHGTNAQARRFASDWLGWMQGQFDQMRHWHDTWMHDSRFPPMMGNATATPTRPGQSAPSGLPYPGSGHMSSMPYSAMPTGVPRVTTTPHTTGGHMTGTPHMTGGHM